MILIVFGFLYILLQSLTRDFVQGSFHSKVIQGHNGNNYISNSEDKFLKSTSLLSHTNASLVVWSSDFHISPVADAKWILNTFGVAVIDKSLSGHCHITNTCAKDLRVITQQNGIELSPCPNKLRQEFFDAYKNDFEMKQVDIVLCTHATSMCELFMPFNKTMVLIASTRYSTL